MDGTSASFYATSSLAAGSSGWKAFPNPCSSISGPSGGMPVAFVSPDTTDLYTLCAGLAGAGNEEKFLFKTTNSVSTLSGTLPSGGAAEALAVTSTGALVVAAASANSELYRSTDKGATWTTAAGYSDGGAGFNDLSFTTASQGVVIHGLPGTQADFTSQLLMTTDSGATWTVAPIT